MYVRALSVERSRDVCDGDDVSSCTTRVPTACYLCFHTELTMRLIKPAVSRLSSHCSPPLKTSVLDHRPIVKRKLSFARPPRATPLRNNTLLFVAHLTDNRNISVSRSRSPPAFVISIPTVRTVGALLLRPRSYRSAVPRGGSALLCPRLEDRGFMHRSRTLRLLK